MKNVTCKYCILLIIAELILLYYFTIKNESMSVWLLWNPKGKVEAENLELVSLV